ncbi:hypothetical protein CR513_35241, partial [Mucuna pruriens]
MGYHKELMTLFKGETKYMEKNSNKKVVDKILRTMPIKFDHMVTTIIRSHNTNTMIVTKLQGSIENHVGRILEKTKK